MANIFVFRKSFAICVLLIAIMQLRLLAAASLIRKAKYIVEKDARIIQSIGISEINNDRSLVQCSSLFISTEDYCTAVFDSTSGTCKLYGSECCSLNTEASIGSLILRKDKSAFTTQNNEDCSFYKNSGAVSGVYMIYPETVPTGISVYCDMDTDGGSWTVIQNRYNGNENFYRTWYEYSIGFGNLDEEFWLGNDNIHNLTRSNLYMLRVDLTDNIGQKRYAEYNTFLVSNEADNYRLFIGQYCGDSGDALFYNNNTTFHTKDHDTTVGFNEIPCSIDRYAGWWYDRCTWANLNGKWYPGILGNWDANYWYQWKATEGMSKISMKIRRK